MHRFAFIFFLFTSIAQAEVRLAFFIYRDAEGQVIEFEPGGQFGHVAIEVAGGWLHSYPYRGVEIEPVLEKIGRESVILIREDWPDVTDEQIQTVLGLPYDTSFRWDDPGSTYCSKLVGQLLGLEPEPMNFDTPYWEGREDLPSGEPGLSPDDIFRAASAAAETAP